MIIGFQEPDSSKEWVYDGIVAIQYTMDWDPSDVTEDRRIHVEKLTESFTGFGKTIQRSFSDQYLHEQA